MSRSVAVIIDKDHDKDSSLTLFFGNILEYELRAPVVDLGPLLVPVYGLMLAHSCACARRRYAKTNNLSRHTEVLRHVRAHPHTW